MKSLKYIYKFVGHLEHKVYCTIVEIVNVEKISINHWEDKTIKHKTYRLINFINKEMNK